MVDCGNEAGGSWPFKSQAKSLQKFEGWNALLLIRSGDAVEVILVVIGKLIWEDEIVRESWATRFLWDTNGRLLHSHSPGRDVL
jgi:hypothetical protein